MDALQQLLAHGSYGAILFPILVAGVGVPVPEDLIQLGAGVLARRGAVNLYLVMALVAATMLVSDSCIYWLSRRFGPTAARRAPVRWFLPPARRARLEALLARRGARLVFACRFVPGTRAATFAASGLSRLSFKRFLIADALGLAILVPVLVLAGYAAGNGVTALATAIVRAQHLLLFAVLAAATLWMGRVLLRRRRVRRNAPTPLGLPVSVSSAPL